MPQNKYLRYRINYNSIFDILNRHGKQKINFFIDLLNICKGLYNKDNIFGEINYYIQHRRPSDTLTMELGDFLNNLYFTYQNFDPFFIIFYDRGYNKQNLSISTGYKQGRSSVSTILEDDQLEMHRLIKHHYFAEVEAKFNVPDRGKVYYLKDYESDLIPYYCLTNNLYDSVDANVLNVILSVDKDLLQCCQFTNTVMCATRFLPGQIGNKQIHFGMYDNINAIEYIYKNFKRGILTAKHVSIILSIMGDKADNIPGLKGFGPAKAVKYVQNYNIPTSIPELKMNIHTFPDVIQNNINHIIQNMKLIDFGEQLKRTKIF